MGYTTRNQGLEMFQNVHLKYFCGRYERWNVNGQSTDIDFCEWHFEHVLLRVGL